MAAAKELILTCGGAFIKIGGGNVELVTPNNLLLKATNVQKIRPASLNKPLPQLPAAYSGKFTAMSDTGTPLAMQNYLITLASGQQLFGSTNSSGETISVNSAQTGEDFEIPMLADDFWYDSEMVVERAHYTNIKDASHHGGDCQCDECEDSEND